jgi:hypothetical protein
MLLRLLGTMPRVWHSLRTSWDARPDRHARHYTAHQDRGGAEAGGAVILHGDAYDEAQVHAEQLAGTAPDLCASL